MAGVSPATGKAVHQLFWSAVYRGLDHRLYPGVVVADRADSGGHALCQHPDRHYYHWHGDGGVSRVKTECLK
ncbi:hypothetical protein D3C76_1873840 [compost metagenome]